jgi:hypothetical protein
MYCSSEYVAHREVLVLLFVKWFRVAEETTAPLLAFQTVID